MKKRITGIDLIRIVAMFMIMNYHVLLYGSWMTRKASGSNLVTGRLLVDLTVISVNLFALVSGYVGLETHHRLGRIVDLWLQVVFFSWLVLAYFYFEKNKVLSPELITHNLFPTFFKGYWYWNGYVLLFILMPILNKGLKSISHRSYLLVMIALFTATSILDINPNYDLFNIGLGYSGIWLIVLYVYGAYFKRFGIPKFLQNKLILIVSGVVVWLAMYGVAQLFYKYKVWINPNNFDITQFQYPFPLNVILAVIVFCLFIQIRIKSSRINAVITFFGKHSFSAYLLQTNPLIFSFLITNNYNFLRHLTTLNMLKTLLLISAAWYFGAIIIDIIREQLFKLLMINRLTRKLNRMNQN